MDVAVQWSVIALAASSVVAAAALVIGLARLLPVLDRMDVVLRQSRRTLLRVNRITGDLEAAARHARHLEGRITHLAEHVVDNLASPLRLVSALVNGTSVGLSSLLGARRAGSRNGAGARARREETAGKEHSTEGGGFHG
jgi:hypothetical protein